MTTAPTDTRRGWRLLACFVGAELAFVAAPILALPLLFVLALLVHRGARTLSPGEVLVAAAVVSAVAAGLVAVLGATLLGHGSLAERLSSQLSLRWRLSDLGIGLALGVLGLAVTVPASLVWAHWVGENQADSAVGEVFRDQRLSPGWALILFFAVWLIAPLCEELVYRGVLWRAMEYWRLNRWVIFGVTTALFSLAHFVFSWSYSELLRTPLLIVITLPLALARLLTGNLLASIAAHQVNNFLPAVALLLLTLGVAPPA